ncbi:YbaY family lipoprotein [Planctomicrobium sp. SH664]|uniref:YbaY family lipoprotein n=1 Tax=Planctomicrobium sp. SH664 TaxID=3448125 RepID=UPI003F5BE14C
MKRISYISAALALGAALTMTSQTQAINPGQSTTTPALQPNYGIVNPGVLPGIGYSNPAIQNDPFLSSSIYNSAPIYPSMGTTNFSPLINPGVPNPDPHAYPDGRSRQIVPGYNPGNPSNNRKWRLGVYSKDLDTGVKIMDVVNGGAAHRAGLEVNDLIVCVSGYQVGYVGGQLYDCTSEFDRSADQNGWVSLLVQNNRNGQLQLVSVQLDSKFSSLRGSIALPNRQNLPNNALINVELQEIVGNTARPVTFASTQINNLTQYPIPFSIDFDPARMSPMGRYIVYASLVSGNREVYRTTQNLPPMMHGQPRTVNLQLEQVQSMYDPRSNSLDQSAQVAQIVNWFNLYLGRNPSDRELGNWLEALRNGASMAQVQQELLGSNQFFNACNADRRMYVERVHELIVGRKPNQEELNYWLSRYDQNAARRDFARDFQNSMGIQ